MLDPGHYSRIEEIENAGREHGVSEFELHTRSFEVLRGFGLIMVGVFPTFLVLGPTLRPGGGSRDLVVILSEMMIDMALEDFLRAESHFAAADDTCESEFSAMCGNVLLEPGL